MSSKKNSYIKNQEIIIIKKTENLIIFIDFGNNWYQLLKIIAFKGVKALKSRKWTFNLDLK